MTEQQLELLQLDNGDVVLQRPDQSGEELVRVRFAPELLHMLGDDLLEVAHAMMEAAADAVGDLQGAASDDDAEQDGWELICGNRGPTLH
ncbi:MAG: hypothetical protein EA417_04280 [Gammaproteobacteria bacterium]|nr:MAG: hypothetical protein EA417_04280 [Gammaproteobacteria bacterium]